MIARSEYARLLGYPAEKQLSGLVLARALESIAWYERRGHPDSLLRDCGSLQVAAFTAGPEVEEEQLQRLNATRLKRDQGALDRALLNLQTAARGTDNTMPHILDAVRAQGTVGEISDALKEIFGSYQETSVF